MPVMKKIWHQPCTAEPIGLSSGSSLDRNRDFLFLLKEALLSHPTNPWTMVASSNRSVASLADNWSSPADISRGSSDTWPGSWMILKSPTGTKGPFYMLLDLTSLADDRTDWYISKDPFDVSSLSPYRVPGGVSTYASPGARLLFGSRGSAYHITGETILVADDGSFVATTQTRAYVDSSGEEWGDPYDCSLVFFNVLDDADPTDPYPFVMFTDDSDRQLKTNQFDSTWRSYGRSIYPDGSNSTCYFLAPRAVSSDYRLDVQECVTDNPLNSQRPFAWPIEVWTVDSGRRMRKGILSDMWWASRWMYSWGQPGYDGQTLVAQQSGCIWLPATQPYRY